MSLKYGLVNLLQRATCLSNTQRHHVLSQNALGLSLQVTERRYIICFSCFDSFWKEQLKERRMHFAHLRSSRPIIVGGRAAK